MKFISKPTLKKKYESAEQSDPNFSNYYKNSPFSRETDPNKVTSKLKNSLIAGDNNVFNPISNYLKFGEVSNTLVYPDPNNNMRVTSGLLGIKYLREYFSHSGVDNTRKVLGTILTIPVALVVDLIYNVPDFIRGSIDSLAQFIQEKSKNTNVVVEALAGLISATLLLANTPLRVLVGIERILGNLLTFPMYAAGFGYDKTLNATDVLQSTLKNLQWVIKGLTESGRLAVGLNDVVFDKKQQVKPENPSISEEIKLNNDQSSAVDNEEQARALNFRNLEQTTPQATKNTHLEITPKADEVLEHEEAKPDRSIKPKSKQ